MSLPPSPVAVKPIGRIGRIVQVQCVTDANGVPTFTPRILNTPCNAFYIIDSPYGIKMQSSVIGVQTYYAQQGESVNQALGNINFVDIATPDYRNVVQIGFAPELVKSCTFYFKIWLGTDSHLGFIDHRTIANPCSVESIFPIQNNTGIIITAGATNQTVQVGNNLSALSYGLYDVGIFIANTDATNTVYLVSTAGTSYIMPLFPQQIYRVPLLINNQFPGGTAQLIYLANPSGSDVVITVARIVQVNGYGIEANP